MSICGSCVTVPVPLLPTHPRPHIVLFVFVVSVRRQSSFWAPTLGPHTWPDYLQLMLTDLVSSHYLRWWLWASKWRKVLSSVNGRRGVSMQARSRDCVDSLFTHPHPPILIPQGPRFPCFPWVGGVLVVRESLTTNPFLEALDPLPLHSVYISRWACCK